MARYSDSARRDAAESRAGPVVPARAREVEAQAMGRAGSAPRFRLFAKDEVRKPGSAGAELRPPTRHVATQAAPTLWSRYYFSSSSTQDYPTNNSRADARLVHYDVFTPSDGALLWDPREDAWGALPAPEKAVHAQKQSLAVMEANLRAAPYHPSRPTGHRDMAVGPEVGGTDALDMEPFVSIRAPNHYLPTFAKWVSALRPCTTQNTVDSMRPVLTLCQGLLRDIVDGKIKFQDEEIRATRIDCERRLHELREIHALEAERMEERHAKQLEEFQAKLDFEIAERRKKSVLAAATSAVGEAKLVDEVLAEAKAAEALEAKLSELKIESDAEIARLKSEYDIQVKLKLELASTLNTVRRAHEQKVSELEHANDQHLKHIDTLLAKMFKLEGRIGELEDELLRVPRQLPSPFVDLSDMDGPQFYRKIKSLQDVERITAEILDRLHAKTRLNFSFLHIEGTENEEKCMRYVAMDSRHRKRLPSLMGREIYYARPTSEGAGIVALALGDTDNFEIGLNPPDEFGSFAGGSPRRTYTGCKNASLNHAIEVNDKDEFINALQPYGKDSFYIRDVREIKGVKLWRTIKPDVPPRPTDTPDPNPEVPSDDDEDHAGSDEDHAGGAASTTVYEEYGNDEEEPAELAGLGDERWRPEEPFFCFGVSAVADSDYTSSLKRRPVGVLCADNFDQIKNRQNFAEIDKEEPIIFRRCAAKIANLYAAMTKNKIRGLRGFGGSIMYLSEEHRKKTNYWSSMHEILAECRTKKLRVEALLNDPMTQMGLDELKTYKRPAPEMMIVLYHSLRLSQRFAEISRLNFDPHNAVNGYLQAMTDQAKSIGVDIREAHKPLDVRLRPLTMKEFSDQMWHSLKELVVVNDSVEHSSATGARKKNVSFLRALHKVDMLSVKSGSNVDFRGVVDDVRSIVDVIPAQRAKRVSTVCFILRTWLATCVEIYDLQEAIVQLEATGKDTWQTLISESEAVSKEDRDKMYVLSDECKDILDRAMEHFGKPSAGEAATSQPTTEQDDGAGPSG